jgi:hypothetical protein
VACRLSRQPLAGSPIVEFNYDLELSPFNAGPYRQDVSK